MGPYARNKSRKYFTPGCIRKKRVSPKALSLREERCAKLDNDEVEARCITEGSGCPSSPLIALATWPSPCHHHLAHDHVIKMA